MSNEKFCKAILYCALICVTGPFVQAQTWNVSGTSIYNANTGNVGIGTSAPAFKFDIQSFDNEGATRFRLANTTSSGSNAPGSFPTIEILGARGDANTTFEARLALGTRITNGLTLSNQTLGAVLFGGQYGIDPTFKIGQILYPASIQGVAEGPFDGANSMPTGITFMTGSMGNDVATPNISYGTEQMRITHNGHIGIGISNPWAKLQIWGGDFATTGDDFNGTAVVTSHGGLAYFGNNTYSNGLGITSSGNILIGQSTQVNSTYKLDVAGNVRAIKLVVNTSGADFVFDSCYSLSSLADIEAYIRKNHHLPGIDSAAKMQKTGMDVGENQTRLLQKIEELTLYIIEQNKSFQEQDKVLKAQEERIRRLEELVGGKGRNNK
jgi:hypothetical protein